MKNGNKPRRNQRVITADVGVKEKRTLERLARECGLTVSDLVRMSIRPLVSGKVKPFQLLARPSTELLPPA